MLQFETIKLGHKEKMDEFLKADGVIATERNFGCLFIWSSYYHTEVCITDEYCFIRMQGQGERYYYPPLLKKTNVSKEELKQALSLLIEKEGKSELNLFGLMNNQVEMYKELFGNNVEVSLNLESSDYIYSAKDLIELKGKKYSAKRNHINQFKVKYGNKYEYRVVNFLQDLDKLMYFHQIWCAEKSGDATSQYEHEQDAILQGIKYADQLGIKGGILFLEEKIIGYTLGCATNFNTFDILIEKATTEIKGAYAMINQCFVKENCSQYLYINREEDLGIDGLKKAKLSYYPKFILEKYKIKIKI